MSNATSPQELVELGLFSDAVKAIDSARIVPRELRILRARLENHVGLPQRSREMATALLLEPLSHKERAACWDIVGRVTLASGMVTEGLKAMSQALVEARASADPITEARFIASHVYSLLGWVGIEPAAIELPKLRYAAMRAADPFAMIEFHTLTGEIAAKRGWILSARTSIDIAKGLLQQFCNVSQQARLDILLTGVEIMEANYEGALIHAEAALKNSRRAGTRELLIPALNNIAYVRLAQAQFEDVKGTLDELLGLIRPGGVTEVGVRDTEMMLALAVGDLERAADLANHIDELSERLEGREHYYQFWHLPTRIKWLYRIGRTQSGVSLALDGLSRLRDSTDRNLISRLKMLAAEGHARLGKPSLGVNLLAEAVIENPDASLELKAETARVAGQLVPDAASRSACFQHAAEILTAVGNVNACREIPGITADVATSEPDLQVQRPIKLSELLERIAAAIDTSSHPALLAQHVASLLNASDAVSTATVARKPFCGDESPAELLKMDPVGDHRVQFVFNTGVHRGHTYEVTALPKDTPSAVLAILALGRVISNAKSNLRSRQREPEHVAFGQDNPAQRELGLICASERMLNVMKTVRQVASSNATVLLTGETGVGKELFAKALHQASTRKDRAFLPFNVTTVPREILDSQLFGHRRGSFTGAQHDSAGIIKSAVGGTLFLDEIGEMSLEAQPKLLRFLESGEILPLGQTKPEVVDVRIVAATNANLEQLMKEGRFREDLYYRLNVIRIDIPPLRERREEIPHLTEHFLERYSRELQKPMPRLADETLEYLILYRWPGNVRQLANEVRRMVALAEPGAVLMPAHLSADIAASRRTVPVAVPATKPVELMTRIDQPLAAIVEHVERAAVQRAMAVCEGRVDEAAKMLGLSRKGLYLKRQRLKIGDDDLRRS